MKQARKNVGAKTCWDGYKAKELSKKVVRQYQTVLRSSLSGDQ